MSTTIFPASGRWLSETGRDPQSVPVALFVGTEDADRLAHYRDLGIARVVVMLPSAASRRDMADATAGIDQDIAPYAAILTRLSS